MFPSVLNTFNRPNAGDPLNAPSHSALHNTVSSALGQVEAVIGVDGASSVVGTMMYHLRSPASQGGGHVQGAAFGGTGQTTFAKGDLFVAQSASVISKLAIGTDNYILQANSAAATGINWVQSPATKVAVSPTAVLISSSTAETSIISTTVPGSTLGTGNALRATIFIADMNTDSDATYQFKASYGNTVFVTSVIPSLASALPSRKGTVDIVVMANGAANSQKGIISSSDFSSVASNNFYQSSIFSVDSGAAQTFGLTVKMSAAGAGTTFQSDGYTVDKIS